jgi:hypothetical protein
VNRSNNEFSVGSLDQIAQLACATGRIGFGILGGEFNLAPGNAAALVDKLHGRLGGFVVPYAPRRDGAGKVAMMADHDGTRGLREGIAHNGEISSTCRGASGERAFEKAAA